MPRNNLRSFLYLDEQTLDDFLASEGSLYTEKAVQTKEGTSGISGEIDLTLVKLGGEKGDKATTEITQEGILNAQTKFHRLYTKLYDENAVDYYETMDETEWTKIGRNTILEAVVNISLTQLGTMATSTAAIARLLKAGEAYAGRSFLDENGHNAVQGMERLGELEEEKGTPVVMSFIGSPSYKLGAYLNPTFLRSGKDRLAGEVTLFCKIQRKLAPREKYDLINFSEHIDKLSINRAQRRHAQQNKGTMPAFLKETIKAPGALVIPIAIYR